MSGRWISPRAISSRRFMPPENVRVRSRAALVQIDEAQRLVDARRALGARHAVGDRVQHQVLLGGQPIVERRVLEDDADPPADLAGRRRDVQPGQARAPRRRLQQRAQDLDRRGLAGAVRARGTRRSRPAPTEKSMPRTASTSPYAWRGPRPRWPRRHARGAHPAQADRAAARRGHGARRARAPPRTRSWRGDSAQAGSVAAASPGSANAWQRQPPKSRVPLVAGPARRRHPVVAAERAQRGRIVPDVAERPVADVLERQAGDARRLVARQHDAVGRDDDVAARPAVHAGARAIGVVVGAHEQDLDLAAQPLARRPRPRRAPARCRRATAAARRGWPAPSRGTACWPAPAARRPSARPARRTPARARCCRGG